MNLPAATSLINFLGFIIGIALYAVLLIMVVRHPVTGLATGKTSKSKFTFEWLLLLTAVLGLFWNAGSLTEILWCDYWNTEAFPFLTAVSYSALGFLPAVIVHSEWLSAAETKRGLKNKLLTFGAYSLSFIAAVLHLGASVAAGSAPSIIGLQILAGGYVIILIVP